MQLCLETTIKIGSRREVWRSVAWWLGLAHQRWIRIAPGRTDHMVACHCSCPDLDTSADLEARDIRTKQININYKRHTFSYADKHVGKTSFFRSFVEF